MTQSTLEDLQALVFLSRTPGIRMHGLRLFFEQGLSPAEIRDRIQSEGKASWKKSLEETRRIFDCGFGWN